VVLFVGVCCRLDFTRGFVLRMRRQHILELARYYQRLENIEKRKRENERLIKINFVVRLIRRLGLFRGSNNRSV